MRRGGWSKSTAWR